ncbi:hypothetical protein T310_10085, partial [Rasamsonia emersonii CBS 393.64]
IVLWKRLNHSLITSHFFLSSEESGSFSFAHLVNSSLLAKAKVIATPLTTVKLRRASSITLIGVSNMNTVNSFSMSTFLLPYLFFCWLFSYQVIGHNQVASKTCLYGLDHMCSRSQGSKITEKLHPCNYYFTTSSLAVSVLYDQSASSKLSSKERPT